MSSMADFPAFVIEPLPKFKDHAIPWTAPVAKKDENPIPMEDRFGFSKAERLAMAQDEFETCWDAIVKAYDAMQTQQKADRESEVEELQKALKAKHQQEKDGEKAEEEEIEKIIKARDPALEAYYKAQKEEAAKNPDAALAASLVDKIGDNRGPSLRALSGQNRGDLGNFQDHCSDAQRVRRKEEEAVRNFGRDFDGECRDKRSDFLAIRRQEAKLVGNAAAMKQSEADNERYKLEAAKRAAERGDTTNNFELTAEQKAEVQKTLDAKRAEQAAKKAKEEEEDRLWAIEEAKKIEWERENLSPEEFALAQMRRDADNGNWDGYVVTVQKAVTAADISKVCGKIYLSKSSGDSAHYKVREGSQSGVPHLSAKKCLYLSNPPKKGEWEIVHSVSQADWVLKIEPAGKIDFTYTLGK